MFKTKEIKYIIQGNGTFRLVTFQVHFIPCNPLVSLTSWEVGTVNTSAACQYSTTRIFNTSQYISDRCTLPKNTSMSFCIQSHFAVYKSVCLSGHSAHNPLHSRRCVQSPELPRAQEHSGYSCATTNILFIFVSNLCQKL